MLHDDFLSLSIATLLTSKTLGMDIVAAMVVMAQTHYMVSPLKLDQYKKPEKTVDTILGLDDTDVF